MGAKIHGIASIWINPDSVIVDNMDVQPDFVLNDLTDIINSDQRQSFLPSGDN
jgi:hypothetical protein